MKLTGGGWTDLLSGDVLAGKENDAEAAALEELLKSYDGITPPDLKEIQLKGNEFQGGYEPVTLTNGPDLSYEDIAADEAALSLMGPSAMEGVSTDPRLQEQQMASMAALDDLAQSGGMTMTDKANLARIGNDVNAADRGRRGAIQQGMAARGMGGSGMDLLAQLQGSQAATDRQAQQSLDVAGMAQDRALDAMLKSGSLAGDIRGQQFGERSAVANAQDAVSRFNTQNRNANAQYNTGVRNDMNRFNAGNRMDTARYNADRRYDTQRYNAGATTDARRYEAGGRQDAANSATDAQNASTKYNAGLPQQQYGNQMDLAGAKAGLKRDQVNAAARKGDRKRDAWGNLIGGAATLGGGLLEDDE